MFYREKALCVFFPSAALSNSDLEGEKVDIRGWMKTMTILSSDR